MSSPRFLTRFNKVLWASALPLALSTLAPLKAEAANFNRLFVFGDSLSDTGNTADRTKKIPFFPIVPPPALPVLDPATGLPVPDPATGLPSFFPAYVNGRFTDSLNWIDYLAPQLGVSPGSIGNFAFTSATTGDLNTAPIPGLPGLQQEVSSFIGLNLKPTADDLFIVWAGNNDYLGGGQTNPTIPVENLEKAIRELASAGAQNILVPNLEDLGKTPFVKKLPNADPDQVSNLVKIHNSLLAGKLTSLEQDPTLGKINLIPLDVYSLFNEALQQPGKFGFTNVSDPCLTNTPLLPLVGPVTRCDDPSKYLFWDSLHPTDKTHQILAGRALEAIEQDSASVPEPDSSWALCVVAGGLALAKLSYKKQLQKAR